jgi:acetoacetyl-CoA synthetase
MNQPLWTPSKKAIEQSQMMRFIQYINQSYQLKITHYNELHQWSIEHIADFWESIRLFFDVIVSKKPTRILENSKDMQKAHWFKGATLNFAENLLRRRDDHPAIVFYDENRHQSQLTYAALFHQVAVWACYLRKIGVQPGDRIAGFMPNSQETVIAMLATTSIGAVWSACSPDFGLSGLLDRFQQIEPRILFAVESHQYNGKCYQHLDKIKQLQTQLTTLEQTIIVPFIDKNPDISSLCNALLWTDIDEDETPDITFEQLPFNHPVYILYSSGTTGPPKCMVHGAGGTLLQHLKELCLHTNLTDQDNIFFYTTCGWMMWNWLVSSLAVGATIVLYDGSPFYPKSKRLLDLIDAAGITVFGVGAKLIENLEKSKRIPKEMYSLNTLRTILTTGSPLLPSSFDYVYTKIKKQVCLSSISGGSDIISCFALGNPILPVYRGALQCLGLGMNVQVFDEEGHSVTAQKGELVCTSPFPSQPVCFWNDPEAKKYHAAYFNQHPNVWAHGDYAMLTQHGGLIIYGRSDTTLNPGGVRIGTAEIYQPLETIDEVIDALAVGQCWQDGERIVLFVVLRETSHLTKTLIKTIKNVIRDHASPHHVPAKIIAVPDLPRTISGKIVELAVKNIIHQQAVKNISALANPDSLDYFKDLDELKKK